MERSDGPLLTKAMPERRVPSVELDLLSFPWVRDFLRFGTPFAFSFLHISLNLTKFIFYHFNYGDQYFSGVGA
jgi:hypothetical protein